MSTHFCILFVCWVVCMCLLYLAVLVGASMFVTIFVPVCVFVCVYKYICISVCMCVCVRVKMYIYVCLCLCVFSVYESLIMHMWCLARSLSTQCTRSLSPSLALSGVDILPGGGEVGGLRGQSHCPFVDGGVCVGVAISALTTIA